MATKSDGYFLKHQFQTDNDSTFTNLNLNQKHKCLDLAPVQTYSKSNSDKSRELTVANIFPLNILATVIKSKLLSNLIFLLALADSYTIDRTCKTAATIKTDHYVVNNHNNYLKQQTSQSSWKKSMNGLSSLKNFDVVAGEETESKKRWMNDSNLNDATTTTYSSTLSLHISAYENAIEVSNDNKNASKKSKKAKSFDSFLKLQNPFEFPRQMDDHGSGSTPEVMQFRATQKLLSPNQDPAPLIQFTWHEQIIFSTLAGLGFLTILLLSVIVCAKRRGSSTASSLDATQEEIQNVRKNMHKLWQNPPNKEP